MEIVRILLVDDDEDDYLITRDLLAEIRGQEFVLDWVSDGTAALEQIGRQAHDIYLLDYHLGAENGLELLRQVLHDGHQGPFILLTGQGDRQTDLEAMRSGAADFLVKGQLSALLLERSIRYAIERCRVEQKLAQMAQYDHLTGLPNRLLLEDRLRQSIALAEREAVPLGLLFLDLDRFKVINDSLGHAAGDAVLKTTAERLTATLRRSDTIARLGGDEFVVLLPHLAEIRNAAMLAGRIGEALAPPLCLNGQEVFLSASIGIAIFPLDGRTPEELLRCADAAMYEAKTNGGCFQYYSPDLNRQTTSRLNQESSLRRGLERSEFHLFYQPQIDLADLTLAGVESLLRWQPAGGPMQEPATFVPLLEETGVILSVGEWALRSACRQARIWQTEEGLTPRVAVNLSGRQLRHPDLLETVSTALRQSGLDPSHLELELTETVMMQHLQETAGILRSLKAMGISLAVDDFGTGYSQLTFLKHFPIDKLKIDRSFIVNIGRDVGDEALTKAIIGMAHSLGIKVIAEGVETSEQLDFLRSHGCDEGQGFLLGRPMAAGEVGDFFRRSMNESGAGNSLAKSAPAR